MSFRSSSQKCMMKMMKINSNPILKTQHPNTLHTFIIDSLHVSAVHLTIIREKIQVHKENCTIYNYKRKYSVRALCLCGLDCYWLTSAIGWSCSKMMMMMMMMIIINLFSCPSQCMEKEMSQCCGIKAVHTDREVTANRPDIIIRNKKETACPLIRELEL